MDNIVSRNKCSHTEMIAYLCKSVIGRIPHLHWEYSQSQLYLILRQFASRAASQRESQFCQMESNRVQSV